MLLPSLATSTRKMRRKSWRDYGRLSVLVFYFYFLCAYLSVVLPVLPVRLMSLDCAVSQELAEEVQKVVEPLRDQLDAVVVFPSMPEVMRLNKVGSFTMQNLGQSKSVVSDFMKKKKKVRRRPAGRLLAGLCGAYIHVICGYHITKHYCLHTA